MLAHIGAIFGFICLIFAVYHFFHALQQKPCFVLREQTIPFPSPHHLDHVPARATEYTFQLLDDLAVAADGAIQPLQVTVNDKNQIIQFFARSH